MKQSDEFVIETGPKECYIILGFSNVILELINYHFYSKYLMSIYNESNIFLL